MRFWLGTGRPHWLGTADVPLFVSAATLVGRKSLPRATVPWALDSGAFSSIAARGCHLLTPREYAANVRLWRDEIGSLEWATTQDWMCEGPMLDKTRMTVGQHQQLTVNSWATLNSIDAELPWVPVLQGYEVDDYHRCADLYERHAATDLRSLPLVGLGSVCRRQGTPEIVRVVRSLFAAGFRNLHGFGVKAKALTGRASVAPYLASADSMSWSYVARREWKSRGRKMCEAGGHRGSCNHCYPWASLWRDRLVRRLERRCEAGVQELLC